MSQTPLSSRTFVSCFSDIACTSSSSARISRRIILNADVLKASKVFAGDVLAVTSQTQDSSSPTHFAIGIAWPSTEIAADAACMSISHMLSAKITAGTCVKISPLSDRRPTNGLPSLRDVQEAYSILVSDDGPSDLNDAQAGKKSEWLTLYLREILVDNKYVYVGQRLQISHGGRERRFTVARISLEADFDKDEDLSSALEAVRISFKPVIWTAGWDTQVVLRREDTTPKNENKDTSSGSAILSPSHDGYDSVGGLDKQVAQIRDLIEIPLTRPDLFRHFGLKPPKGILLHGPPGTGKTHLARAVVASTRSSVLVVNGSELSSVYHGETEARLRDVFIEARRRSPCIVVLDEVDALCPKREEGAGGEVEKRVVATLLTIMDGMGGEQDKNGHNERVVVIATTNRPNAIDPALRRPGRFDREIEIGIPDANARYAILKVILGRTPHNISEDDLFSVASRTHGYVGADLSAVVREAGTIAIKEWMKSAPTVASSDQETSFVSDALKSPSLPFLTFTNLIAGLALVQPSAMREVFMETPAVRWADIGGQAHVQQKLRECIEWPLRHPEAFARLGVRAPKGVLLYGPPGCSKTLTARALATESGLNFIAVKGPELLNKFVGESERAVREIFRKARAASPSIVFFDEIDALGTSRSAGDSGNRQEGVLTTLLNEMDGVQELVGVTVVAATNRPEVIDSALMRPGRLDRILYVGPPDRQGRVDILRIRMRQMAVGSDVNLEELADLTEGCSGAELAALCQDAALVAMQEDINAPHVPRLAFITATKGVRRQITPQIVKRFELWKEQSGLTSA